MKNKQSFYIILGNLVYLAAQWGLTVVVVRFSDDYYMAGLLALATTITSVFFVVAIYGLRSFQVSDITKKYADQSYILSRVLTMGVAFVACAVYVLALGYDAVSFRVVMLYMLYKSFEAASDVFYGIFQNNDRFDRICTSMCVKGILSVLVFAACLALGSSLEIALCAMLAVAALTFFFLDVRWGLQYARPLVHWTREAWGSAIRLLWAAALMLVLHLAPPLLMSIPRLYFEHHYTTELLGVYAALATPTAVISTFVTCAMMPYLPLFARYYYAGDKKGLTRLTVGSMLFTACFGALALLAGSWLGEWGLAQLYGDSIRAYAHVFLLVIVVTTLSAATMCLNALFIALRKFTSISIALALSCLLCQLITPYFVNTYGMEGITYALMGALGFQVLTGIGLATWYIRKTPAPTA